MGIVFGLIFAGLAFGIAFRYPKQALKAVGTLFLVAAIAFGGFLLHEENERDARKALENNIEVSVTYNLELCQKEFPLFVAIHNKNEGHRLSSITLWPEARTKGRSSNQWSEPGYSMIESDYIVEPGGGIGNCYRLPEGLQGNPEDMQFSAKKGWAVIDAVAAK